MAAIPDLPAGVRYNVKLVHKIEGEILADVAWTLGADRFRVAAAVLELLVMKEKNGADFQGDIIISETVNPILCPKCEEDGVDYCGPLLSVVQDTGGDVPGERYVPTIQDWNRIKSEYKE